MEKIKNKVWGYRWWILILLWLIYLINYLDRMAVLTCLPFIQKDLNLTPQQVGWLGSSFFAFYALAQFSAGYLSDKMGAKKTMNIAISVFTFFTFLTGAVQTFWQFIVLRAGLAAGEGHHYTPAMKTISAWFPGKERGTVSGLFATTWLVSPAVSPLIISFMLINWFGGQWRPIFYVLCVPGIIGIILLNKYVFDTPEEGVMKGIVTKEEYAHIQEQSAEAKSDNTSRVSYKNSVLFKDPLFYPMATWYIFQLVIFWGMTTWLTMFLVKQHGLNINKMGLYASLPYVFAILASITGGRLLDKVFHGHVRPMAIGCYLCTIPILYFMGKVESTGALLVLLLLSGVTVSLLWSPIMTWPLLRYPKEVVGRATGWLNGLGYIGAFLSPMIAGYLVKVLPNGTYDFNNVFIFFSLDAVVALIAVCFLKPGQVDAEPYKIVEEDVQTA